MNNLHLSHEAQNDLAEIKEYISVEPENPTAALSTVRKITRAIQTLRDHAMPGTPLSSIADVESDYRFLVSGSYLTFYRVYDTEVYVDRVLYGRRDYMRILSANISNRGTTD